MSTLLHKSAVLAASMEEIDISLSTYLKIKMNSSKKASENYSKDKLVGLKPDEDKGFFANICEPEEFKGLFYVCQEPCFFVGIDKRNKDNWKLTHCRRICDKVGKAGVCRRALVKVSYV